MAIRIGKTIELRDLNAATRTKELFESLGTMFAGERGERAKAAAVAVHEAMLAFEMVVVEEEAGE